MSLILYGSACFDIGIVGIKKFPACLDVQSAFVCENIIIQTILQDSSI